MESLLYIMFYHIIWCPSVSLCVYVCCLFSSQYSQTCLYDHLYKTTTHLRWPMLSPPKPIPIQLLLYKMTTCLMRPTTTFFVPQMKKTCLKQPLQNVHNNWTFIFKIGIVFPIILVVKTLDSQYRTPDSNLLGGFNIRSFQPFIQVKLIKWLPATSGDWVVKSELSPRSGSVALRHLNSIHKKEL